jgi:hypothetical protein
MTRNVARRSLLIGAGASALAVGAVAVPAVSASAATSVSDGDGLTGAWLIQRMDAGATSSVQAVLTFASGGAFTTADINPPAPAALGTWTVDSDHHFEATFWIGQSSPQGNATVKVTPQGSWSEDSVHGTYRFTVFAGGKTVATGHGSFHGTRIEP